MKDIKLLILIKNFGKNYLKHRVKYEMIQALEPFADVYYWGRDGDIFDIIKEIGITPDFILHYDIAWGGFFSPKITNLEKVDIPKGCYVIDVHWEKRKRNQYFTGKKIDMIFSVTKNPFLKEFPDFQNRFRWTPFSINPDIFKDWELEKTIKFLLMGLVHYDKIRYPPKGRYQFREEVLKKLGQHKDFKFIKHPGNRTRNSHFVNENYAQEINRSEIFFTCGGRIQYPVAKFFEAPACRTLLLAEPNPDILELGFKDEINYVACNYQNVYEKAMYYSENKSERERISDNGFAFIHQYHSNQVRAKQFINYIKDFMNGV